MVGVRVREEGGIFGGSVEGGIDFEGGWEGGCSG